MYRLTVRTSIPNTNGTICEFLQSQLWSVPYPWPSSYFPEFSFWLVPDFRSSENLEIFSNLKNRLIIDPVVGPLSELNVQFLLNAAFWTLIYILTLLPASNQRSPYSLILSLESITWFIHTITQVYKSRANGTHVVCNILSNIFILQ